MGVNLSVESTEGEHAREPVEHVGWKDCVLGGSALLRGISALT